MKKIIKIITIFESYDYKCTATFFMVHSVVVVVVVVVVVTEAVSVYFLPNSRPVFKIYQEVNNWETRYCTVEDNDDDVQWFNVHLKADWK